MTRNKMSVTQLTLLTSLSMMGAGIVMLPTKFASLGMVSMLSWLITATGAAALAYVFAQCGMLSKKPGGMGGFAEYAFGVPGSFMTNYCYGLSLLIGNIAIALASANYGLYAFNEAFSPISAGICAIVLLWITTALNFPGPGFTGRFTAAVIWALLLPLLFLTVSGPFFFNPELYAANWNPAEARIWDIIPASVPMTFWAFLGLESACANAEAVEEPEKNVPKAVLFATLLTAFIYISTTNLIAGSGPNEAFLDTEAPFGIVYAEMFGEAAKPIAAILIWIGCTGSLVTWQFTMGRVFKSTAEVGFFPKIFKHVTSNNATVKGLVILTVLQTILIPLTMINSAYGQYEKLSDLAVFISIFVFVFCLGGGFALSRTAQITENRARRIRAATLLSFICILVTLAYFDSFVMKAGSFALIFGSAIYAVAPSWSKDELATK